jgi:hypothetical protein
VVAEGGEEGGEEVAGDELVNSSFFGNSSRKWGGRKGEKVPPATDTDDADAARAKLRSLKTTCIKTHTDTTHGQIECV